MPTVNPIQTFTYFLTVANNPVTFGVNTDIEVNDKGSFDAVYGAAGTPWRVTNAGKIVSATPGSLGAAAAGVALHGGGSVNNQDTGSIAGPGNGVYVNGGVATVINAGAISGSSSYSTGVDLFAGGSVTNHFGGAISGGYNGIYVKGGAGSVSNDGNISATYTGVHFTTGGSVTNGARGVLSGGDEGVLVSGGAGKVTNAGAISGTGGELSAVALLAGGSVSNLKGGVISGVVDGVYVSGGAAKVTNQKGGAITGASYGVYVTGGAASVTDAGAISGASGAVKFAGSGANTLTLQSGAALTGAAIGSTAAGATNALVLEGAGSTGALFRHFNTLTVQSSAKWTLSGRSAFAHTTVEGYLKISYALSTTLTIAGGRADFLSTLQGNTRFKGAGELDLAKPYGGVISGFRLGDTIDLLNVGTETRTTLDASGNLTLTGGRQNTTLSFANSADFSAYTFVVKADGHGGTDVALAKRPSKAITFNEFLPGTSITTQYRNYGVEFLPDKVIRSGHTTTSRCTIYWDLDDPTRPDLVNSANGPDTYSGPIVGKFVDPNTGANGTVTQFSFDAGDFNSLGSTLVEWFDSQHHLIGKQPNLGLGFQHFAISSRTPIASFEVISKGQELSGFGIDNLLVGHVTG